MEQATKTLTRTRAVAFLGFAGIVAFLALLGWGLLQPGSGLGGTGVNAQGSIVPMTPRPAPDLRLQLFGTDAGPWRLLERRGAPVVINFWASWCAPCRTEASVLAQAARDYQARGISVVGVNLWDEPAPAQAFLMEFGIAYPNGRDVGGTAGVDYGITGIPETFVVDAQGQITRRWVGPVTRPTLDSLLGLVPPK